MKKSYHFIAALPLILILGFILFLGMHKDVWFCDEVYTYYSSNGINKINPLASTEWISGTDVKNYFSATSLSDPTFSDISTKLFSDHVPLYFWIFHIFSVVFMGSCSKWIGLLINVCFSILVYVLLFRCFNKFGKNSVLFSSLAAAAIMLHPLSLTEITTIRMYFMFSACQFAVIYLAARNQTNVLNFILLTVSTACGLLTHYYFWSWIAFFSAFYLLYLLIKESIKSKIIYHYGFSMVAAMALTTLLFRYWKYKLYFHGGKGEVAMENLLKIDNIGKSVLAAIKTMSELIIGTKTEVILVISGAFFVLLFILFCIFSEQNHMKSIIIITVLSALGNAVLVVLSQPSDEPRYLWPSCILLLFTFVYMLASLSRSTKKKDETQKRDWEIQCVSISVILILLGMNIARSSNFENISYLKNRTEEEWQAIQEN